MAKIYVRSTDGSDSDDGSTWALAKASLAGAAAIAAAGDTVYVSQSHAETDSSNLTLTWAGTLAAPIQILCVDDAAEPPTTLAGTASINKTGGANISVNGCFYSRGVSYVSNAVLSFNPASTAGRTSQVFDGCLLRAESSMNINAVTDAALLWLKNATLRFGGAGSYINVGCRLRISGGSVAAGSATPTNFMYAGQGGRGGLVEIEGFDFSNFSAGFSIAQAANMSWSGKFILRNCKLPAGWSGSLINGAMTGYGAVGEMHNCDAGDTNYRFRVQGYSGQIDSDIAVYRTGGASDGTTPISWRMTSSAGAVYPTVLLETPDLPAVWNTATGSSKTATVEITHDGATPLADGDVWLEVQYLGTNGSPLSTFVSDQKSLLAAGSAQATSAASWTGDSGTGPNGSATWHTLKLECNFTPQEAGYVQARVFLAKPSTTVFVDPKITVA